MSGRQLTDTNSSSKWSKSVTFYTTCLLNLYGSAAAKIYYLDSLNGNATKSSSRDRICDVLSFEKVLFTFADIPQIS